MKIPMRLLLMVVLCAGFLINANATQAASDKAFVKDIKHLLVLTGSDKLGMQIIANMSQQYRAMFPSVPEKFWDAFVNEITGEDLVNLVVPVYVKHYTHEEIKGLIVFYETPLGKKVIQVTPAVMQESMALGQIWGKEIAERIRERMIAEGYIDA